MVEVESFLGTEAVPQAAQLDGKGPLVADEGVRGLIAASASPQLKLRRVQTAHFQVLQRQLDAAARRLVGSHAERFALQQKSKKIVRTIQIKVNTSRKRAVNPSELWREKGNAPVLIHSFGVTFTGG